MKVSIYACKELAKLLLILNFVCLFVFFFTLQAQFVLCIIHTLRALFSQQCQFSKFISALLLLNSTIFFCLFMNFYIQAYKKGKDQKTTVSSTAAIKSVTEMKQLQQKSYELNNNNSQEVLPLLNDKKCN